MAVDKSLENKRRIARKKPDLMDMALIDLDLMDEFRAERAALVVDITPNGGCGLVMIIENSLRQGQNCRIKLGDKSPRKAKVIWRNEVDESLVRLGLEFIP